MFVLVIGGAASGKSEYAEHAVLTLGGNPRIYLATMLHDPRDPESAMRIARHRALRAGKGFETVERSLDLPGVRIAPDASVLLECLSNLVANELFDPRGAADNARHAILSGIETLHRTARHLVVVSNALFSDGILYDEGTMRYLSLLADIHAVLAKQADAVIEVVCGIALPCKGERI